MVRAATEPSLHGRSSTARRKRTNPDDLQERVLELERYKIDDEREQCRESGRRTNELRTARRLMQREIRKGRHDAEMGLAEVGNLDRACLKLAECEERSLERKQQLDQRFDARLTDLETRQAEMIQLLREKVLEAGAAQGRLAHLRFALRSLDEEGLIVPLGEVPLGRGMADDGGHALQPAGGGSGSRTDALRREVDALRAETDRLEAERAELGEGIDSARRILELDSPEVAAAANCGLSLPAPSVAGAVAATPSSAARTPVMPVYTPAGAPLPSSAGSLGSEGIAVGATPPAQSPLDWLYAERPLGQGVAAKLGTPSTVATSISSTDLLRLDSVASTSRLPSSGASSRVSFGSGAGVSPETLGGASKVYWPIAPRLGVSVAAPPPQVH